MASVILTLLTDVWMNGVFLQAISPMEHNGEDFKYKLSVRNIADDNTKPYIVAGNKTSKEIETKDTYQKYGVRVAAENSVGAARGIPQEVFGYSGMGGKDGFSWTNFYNSQLFKMKLWFKSEEYFKKFKKKNGWNVEAIKSGRFFYQTILHQRVWITQKFGRNIKWLIKTNRKKWYTCNYLFY